MTLTSNTWLQPKASVGDSVFAGNPQTTYKKGQINMKLDFKIRQPFGTPWRQMVQDQFAPNQRLYLISFFRGQTADVDDLAPRVDYDNLITAYNAG